MSKESLESYLANLQFFSKVQIINDDHPVDQSDKDKFDIFLKMDFLDTSFFEPYCIFTLMIIPCTPPVKWVLTIEATDKKNNTKKYTLKEDAVMVTWLFGFLLPGSNKSEVKSQDLKENMLNNLIIKLNEDGLIGF